MIIVTGGSDGLGAAIIAAAVDAGYVTMNISRHKNPQATLNIEADLSTAAGVEKKWWRP